MAQKGLHSREVKTFNALFYWIHENELDNVFNINKTTAPVDIFIKTTRVCDILQNLYMK